MSEATKPVGEAVMREMFIASAITGICANPNFKQTDVAHVADQAIAVADMVVIRLNVEAATNG